MVHIAIKLDCCFNVCQPFFNFFKHLVVVELESGSESFDKFLQKLGISNHGLHVYFNILKNSTAQLLKEHGFDHQIIFYSTNADCSGLILIKDKPTPTIGSLISSTKTPVGASHNRPERLTQQKVIYIRRLITYSKKQVFFTPNTNTACLN